MLETVTSNMLHTQTTTFADQLLLSLVNLKDYKRLSFLSPYKNTNS